MSHFPHHRTDRRRGHGRVGHPTAPHAAAGPRDAEAGGGSGNGAASGYAADAPAFGTPGGMLARAGRPVMLTAGIAAVALGVLVVAWPKATLLVTGVLFGVYLLVSGVLQLVGAFSSHVPAHLRTLGFVSGTLCVLLGLICFRGAAESVLLLALWIGFGWLLRGGTLMAVALSGRDLPARGWQLLLGAVTFLGGVVLVVSPFGSLAALTVVAGIWLLAVGAAEIVHALRLRSAPAAARAR